MGKENSKAATARKNQRLVLTSRNPKEWKVCSRKVSQAYKIAGKAKMTTVESACKSFSRLAVTLGSVRSKSPWLVSIPFDVRINMESTPATTTDPPTTRKKSPSCTHAQRLFR